MSIGGRFVEPALFSGIERLMRRVPVLGVGLPPGLQAIVMDRVNAVMNNISFFCMTNRIDIKNTKHANSTNITLRPFLILFLHLMFHINTRS